MRSYYTHKLLGTQIIFFFRSMHPYHVGSLIRISY